MVQISSSILVLLPFLSLSLGIPARPALTKRTVDQVKADLSDLSSKISALDTAITNYPASGNLASALGIHNSAVALVGSLKKSTTDVTTTGPVGETDGQFILSSVETVVPTIEHALTEVVAKKSGFTSLPIGGVPALILQDLTYLRGNTSAFADALITNAPADLTADATGVKTEVVAAFDKAVAAYSS